MDGVFGSYGFFASLGFIMATTIPFLRGMLPKEYLSAVWDYVLWLLAIYINVHVCEYSIGGFENQMYSQVESYLATLLWESHLLNINISLPKNASKQSYELPDKERVRDTFRGVTFLWVHHCTNQKKEESSDPWSSFFDSNGGDKKNFYTLTVHRRHKYTLLPEYLKHIRERGSQTQHMKRDKLLYTNGKRDYGEWPYRRWKSVPFKHPSTFDSIAMEPEDKARLMSDLRKFKSSEESYRLAGRAWKRGYLLYGPPGTGKSSLIGAIANFMNYDVYDLELTEVKSNGELRRLLMDIGNKSIIVIEDLDCSIELKKRGKPAAPEPPKDKSKDEGKKEEQQVTLSGLLNFTDGLWSSCGSERIIIFTTNHVEEIDPALLRSGRMDVKVHLSYAKFGAFKVMASTYLRITEHDLFPEIETLFSQPDVQITPADLAEIMVANGGDDDPEAALQAVIAALKDPSNSCKHKNEETEQEAPSEYLRFS